MGTEARSDAFTAARFRARYFFLTLLTRCRRKSTYFLDSFLALSDALSVSKMSRTIDWYFSVRIIPTSFRLMAASVRFSAPLRSLVSTICFSVREKDRWNVLFRSVHETLRLVSRKTVHRAGRLYGLASANPRCSTLLYICRLLGVAVYVVHGSFRSCALYPENCGYSYVTFYSTFSRGWK